MKLSVIVQQKEMVRLHKVASWYDSAKDFDSSFINFEADSILKRAKGPRVLEMGCASGVMTRRLADRFPNLCVVEAVTKYIEVTRHNVSTTGVKFYQSLFERFVPESRFDDIVMASLLEHVASPVRLLRRVRTWLKPGGRIHVVVPNARSLHRRIGVAMGILSKETDMSDRDLRIGHRRVYTSEALAADLRAAQFQVRHREGIFLKPLSNAQMESWDARIVKALLEVGKELPDYCAELYFCCEI